MVRNTFDCKNGCGPRCIRISHRPSSGGQQKTVPYGWLCLNCNTLFIDAGVPEEYLPLPIRYPDSDKLDGLKHHGIVLVKPERSKRAR